MATMVTTVASSHPNLFPSSATLLDMAIMGILAGFMLLEHLFIVAIFHRAILADI